MAEADDTARRPSLYRHHHGLQNPSSECDPQAYQPQRIRIGLLIDQDQVRLHVAVAMIGPHSPLNAWSWH